MNKNYIETKIIYSNEFNHDFEFYTVIEDMFVEGKKAGWNCIQGGRMKSGVKFFIFMREIAE